MLWSRGMLPPLAVAGSSSCAEEPGPEQPECQARICASLKAAEKLEKIRKRTIKLGQQLEMILHKERELGLRQLSRSVR